jgi:hypothetical protein
MQINGATVITGANRGPGLAVIVPVTVTESSFKFPHHALDGSAELRRKGRWRL